MGELTLEAKGVPLQRWVLATTSWASSGNDVIQPTLWSSLHVEETYYTVSDNQPGEFHTSVLLLRYTDYLTSEDRGK